MTINSVVPSVGARSRLRPMGQDEVQLTDGFWRERTDRNRSVSLLCGLAELERAGNLAYLQAAATGGAEPPEIPEIPDGYAVNSLIDVRKNFDSETYKWLEAVGWSARAGLPDEVRDGADVAISLIERAQMADGYLHSWVQVHEPDRRWAEWRLGHELYCGGHLIQAAIAWARAAGDERLLNVACAFADHLAKMARLEPEVMPRHPGIESALVELYRITGRGDCLQLAQAFIERRGHNRMRGWMLTPEFFLDDLPVRQAARVRGHAVMALYLLAGAVDAGVEAGDEELVRVAERQWADMVAGQTYVTGGVGSRYYEEGFGDRYELPNDRSYAETCAAIASVMLSYRLLLATGEAKYADLIERTVYNAVLAGVSIDGTSFLYANPLQVRDDEEVIADSGGIRRQSWFTCACCPPNVMRFLACLPHYVAARSELGVAIYQLMPSTVRVGGPGGAELALEIRSDLPWGRGQVEIEVGESGHGAWELFVRRPAWSVATQAELLRAGAGEGASVGYDHRRRGFVFNRVWARGDRVKIDLRMRPRFLAAHPAIDACRGLVAIERGPVVYCLEARDLPRGVRLRDVAVDFRGRPRLQRVAELDGCMGLRLKGEQRLMPGWLGLPYRSASRGLLDLPSRPVELLAVPYGLWGNRDGGAMRVWVPGVSASAVAMS